MEHSVYILSLGCAKNLVDSQVMCGAFERDGFVMTDDPAQAEAIVINTCGFIEAAKSESIAAILELAEYKQSARCRVLAAVGCMPEKYAADMLEAMPELDAVSGSRDYPGVSRLIARKLGLTVSVPDYRGDSYLLRKPDGSASAYLKIAEGCDNQCSYCLIPQLRGAYVSRPMEDILAEARRMCDNGVRELVLIAQDTSCYGWDLYHRDCLAELLDAVAELPFAMIRLLYAYPDTLSEAAVQAMARHGNICRYLDIPVQHGADRVLTAMNRGTTGAELLAAIARLRRYMPDIALRSTVMVGFPGETEEDFAALLNFLQQAQFDWLGAFAYSQEEDTPAAELPDQIDPLIKQQRLDQVMELAAVITEQRLRRFVGQELTVLCEGADTEREAEDDGSLWYVGRSQYQAPEVDGVIFFRAPAVMQLAPQSLCNVRITDSEVYDLIGELIGEVDG